MATYKITPSGLVNVSTGQPAPKAYQQGQTYIEKKPVYRTVFDQGAFDAYQRGQITEFENRQLQAKAQKEAQAKLEQEQRAKQFRGKEKMFSGRENPQLSFAKKREARATQDISNIQQSYSQQYASQYEADRAKTLKDIEQAQSRFYRQEIAGYQDVLVGSTYTPQIPSGKVVNGIPTYSSKEGLSNPVYDVSRKGYTEGYNQPGVPSSPSISYSPSVSFIDPSTGKATNIDVYAKQINIEAASGKLSQQEYDAKLGVLQTQAKKSLILGEKISTIGINVSPNYSPTISAATIETRPTMLNETLNQGYDISPISTAPQQIQEALIDVPMAYGKSLAQRATKEPLITLEQKKDYNLRLIKEVGKDVIGVAAFTLTRPDKAIGGTLEYAFTKPFGFVTQSLGVKGGITIFKTSIGKIGSIGIPKTELKTLKGSSESFPLIKGGIKELQAKLYSGKTQTFLKKQFPELFNKKDVIAIRTTTKTTTLTDVGKLAQYEEVAPFYGTDVSLIGLPQFKGAAQRVISKISLFKSGTEKGMIEALVPKGFRKLPTLKTAKTISFREYKNLSEFVGIKLESLGVAKKGLGRIRVKAGESILAREFSKVKSGARPFKLREIDVLTGGREATMKAFVESKAKPGFVYPTRAFQLGATTESEVALFNVKGVSLERFGVTGLRQKYLGSPSLIATEGFESAGVRFYKPISAVELAKKPLLERISIKLEQAKIATRGEVLKRYARGEVYEYRPLVTSTRIGLLGLNNKGKGLEVSRVVERELNIPVRSRVVFREVSRKIVVPVRESVRRVKEEFRPSERIIKRDVSLRVPEVIRDIRIPENNRPFRVVVPLRTTRPITRITTVPRRIPTTTRVPTLIPRVPPTIPTRIPTTTRVPNRITARSPKISKGFSVFSRVRGKKVKLAGNVPFNLATGIGKKFTAETTARSFVVAPEGLTTRPDIGGINLFQYRQPKASGRVAREGFKFVEKSKFAIDTIGEVRGLKAGKFKAKLFS